MKNKKIYIAGPMTGIKDFNYEAFEAAEIELKKQYKTVVNPHKIHGTDDKSLPYKFYLKNDIRALIDCDEIYLLLGSENSTGAKLEREIAIALNLERHYQR